MKMIKKEKPKKAVKFEQTTMTIAEHNADMKQYLGVLSENFQHGLSAVAEQLLGMNNKIEIINERLDGIDGRLGRVEQVQASQTEMIGSIMESMETVKMELKRKVDYDEFIQLERRVMSLEMRTIK